MIYEVRADTTGSVAAIYFEKGEQVKADDELIQLEVMKMYDTICSDYKGVVLEVCVIPGEIVETGTVLMKIQVGG